MLGLLDRYYKFRKCRDGYIEPKADWKPKMTSFGQTKTTWFCFVPSIVSRVPLIRRGLIPKEGDVFVYTISSFDLITRNPEETVVKLSAVYADALEKMHIAVRQGNSINLLGVSLGNVISIRLANQAQTKIKKLVSIVGGGNLGLSGWDSILTGHIARQSGCISAEKYEEKLSIFSPVNYIDGVDADKVIIRLGTHDLLIAFEHGKKLVDAFIKRSQKTLMEIDYKAYRGADHASALFFSSLENLYHAK